MSGVMEWSTDVDTLFLILQRVWLRAGGYCVQLHQG